MKIRMNTSIAGPGFVAGVGDVIERPDTEAKRLIEAGYAEAVKPVRKTKKTVETSALSTPETATEK